MELFHIVLVIFIISQVFVLIYTFVGMANGTVASSGSKRHRIDHENWARTRRMQELQQHTKEDISKQAVYEYLMAMDEEDLWQHDYRDRPKRPGDIPSPEAVKKWLQEDLSSAAE